MRRYGITFPIDQQAQIPEQEHLVRELDGLGYTDLWSAEASGSDGFIPLALAAAWAPQLRLGTAIVPAYTRGPATLAQSAATLASAAPGRFALGIGSSTPIIVERWNGIPFDRPYQRVRDTVRFLRAALSGAKVSERYETFTVDGFRLQLVPPEPPRLLVAALRPGMLRLAGREADGAIVNWLSADDVRTVAPYVHGTGEGQGGDQPGQDGQGKEIVARIYVAPTADEGLARDIARRAIAAYLNVDVYRAFHEWLGRGDRLEPMWRAWAAGDRRGAVAAVPDSVVDELVVHGSPEACREHVQRYVDAGVTTPVLALFPVGGDLRKQVRDLAPASA
jgi:probable F420-dependent oxidoreductase